MRCVITGGSGFIGRHLARALLRRAHDVRIASRFPADRFGDFAAGAIAWLQTDLCAETCDWPALLAGCDVVYHLAWTGPPAFTNRDAALDVQQNVVPGLRLLHAAACKTGTRVVFISSGGYVYGAATEMPIAETVPSRPSCAYGLSKTIFESYLALFGAQRDLDYRVLRVSNAFGAGQDTSRSQGVVTTFIDRAIKGLPLEVWGSGSVVRDYIHVSDIVEALVAAGELDTDAMNGHRVFNVGSGVGRTVNQVIASLHDLGLSPAARHTGGRAFDVPANVLDISRAERHLDWRPRLDFEQALRQTALDLGWSGQRRQAGALASGV